MAKRRRSRGALALGLVGLATVGLICLCLVLARTGREPAAGWVQMLSPPAPTATSVPVAGTVRVVKVVDGDTIEIASGGQVYRVRYIGIDAQEYDQPCGPASTEANRKLVGGKAVRLEKDLSETDKYGRLLRYVWVGDVMVNAELVRQGYATATTYLPDVQYRDLFYRLQREAEGQKRGCWASLSTDG